MSQATPRQRTADHTRVLDRFAELMDDQPRASALGLVVRKVGSTHKVNMTARASLDEVIAAAIYLMIRATDLIDAECDCADCNASRDLLRAAVDSLTDHDIARRPH